MINRGCVIVLVLIHLCEGWGTGKWQYPWKCKRVQYSTLVDEDANVAGAPEHDKPAVHLPQKLHRLCAAKHQCLQWTERFFRDTFAPALYRRES